ncbi:5948_t:CDS:2, partial [Diversispora eburnea]
MIPVTSSEIANRLQNLAIKSSDAKISIARLLDTWHLLIVALKYIRLNSRWCDHENSLFILPCHEINVSKADGSNGYVAAPIREGPLFQLLNVRHSDHSDL